MSERAPFRASASPPVRADDTALDRFEVLGNLGAGGMGIVYRALDRRRGVEVALKTLRKVTGAGLYRFKREFRMLADLTHPNLVRLHELHTLGDDWFLTMDLVDGVPFIDWVRPSGSDDAPATEPTEDAPVELNRSISPPGESDDPTRPGREPPRTGGLLRQRQRVVGARARFDRLEEALYQLADTIDALHQVGRLHRDLKPSNVLVDATGHVVVLDFGLVADIHAIRSDFTHDGKAAAVGTPAYMSPEQGAGDALGPASDWYSVGVMLYEALTGRRPYDLFGEASFATAQLPPPRDEGTPAALAALCLRLLEPDPARRAGGAEILAALGRTPSPASQTLVREQAPAPFVGRDAELTSLRGALDESRTGACVAVFLRAASGMGKSALLRRFLDEVSTRHDAVVLRGRCYERESVPFKTLDAVVDALATHLVQLSEDELSALLPVDIAALARLFPVLLRVPALGVPEVLRFVPPDPLELRQRGFGALRVLLQGLGRRQPVIVAIDDVQWGDADSGAVLAEILLHPDPPAMLLVASYRSEDEDVTPLRAALERGQATSSARRRALAIHELTLGPLSTADARQLVATLGGPEGAPVDDVVREAGGSLLFLAELARLRRADDHPRAGEALTLDAMLGARMAALSPEAGRLLAVCAAAARPLDRTLALRAAGLDAEGAAVATLCAERLLRLRQPADGAAGLETYHDRIRSAVLARLAPEERRRVHATLAELIANSPAPDDEALVGHFREAGELGRAAHHAASAARAAEGRVAFHAAANLYAFAIAHGAHDEDARRDLRTRLGHTLAHAGRLDEAAAAFALAAAGAPAEERLELERLEVEQLLRSGHFEAGLAKSRAVLAAVGDRVPTTRLGAVASLLGQRLLVRLRGLDVDAAVRPEPRELARLDVLWSVASGFAFASPMQGQVLQMRFLRAALASGDPHRIGLALSTELVYLSLAGVRHRPRAEYLRVHALALAERHGDKEATGVIQLSGGLASFLVGRWREAKERLHEAEVVLRNECTHVRWQLDVLEAFRISAAWNLGETAELARLVPIFLRAAEERGDAYARRLLRGWRGNLLWIVLDQPDEVRLQVSSVALPRRPDEPAQVTHCYELMAHMQADLYTGEAAAAYARIEAMWQPIRRGLLLRVQNVFVELWFLRARAALALAATHERTGSPARRELLARAEQAAKRIASGDTGYGVPLAAQVRATIAHLEGQPERAATWLREAVIGFASLDMALAAAATRARLGEVLGGDDGRALVDSTRSFMHAQAIVNPAAMLRMLTPGW